MSEEQVVENVQVEENKPTEENNQSNENIPQDFPPPPQTEEQPQTTEEQPQKEVIEEKPQEEPPTTEQPPTSESPKTEEKQTEEQDKVETVEGENKSEESTTESKSEQKKEDANDNLKEWTSKFVDNCANEELKNFIVFTLEKIDNLNKRLGEQEELIKNLQQSKGGEMLSNPKKSTLRSRKPPSKPLTELGEGITVERPPDSTGSSESSAPSVSKVGGMGMGMGMMGGMMGELSSRLTKRSSTVGGSEKVPLVVKNPPLKNPPINPLAVKLKSTGSKGVVKAPVKN
eukprot:TRINITY_DN6805_c0_g1_i2.p1 TRINITY_DN6805_c0_g1~~TRINITY_DN6805_c0_g1_i2.p1  ORF type:complete len:287 (-),score=144.52 TRINITY_DN6805_c0_g1_i2:164-1024(-)